MLLLPAGVVLLAVAAIKDLGPDNRLYSCDQQMNCRVVGVSGPLLWPWYVAGAVFLVAAGVVLYRRGRK